MDYARKHVKRYWGMSYRRTLGLALVTIAIVISMGLTFSILRGTLATSNYTGYLSFWLLLIFIAIATIASSFFGSHVSSVKFMNEFEHKSHSRYTAIWLMSVVLGIVAFILPLLFVKSDIEPIVVLFAYGGVLWVIYATIKIIFKHSYGELAIGGTALWIMFIVGLIEVHSSGLSYVSNANFALYLAALSITVISGFTGLALLINTTRDALSEFTGAIEELEVATKTTRKRGTRLRQRRPRRRRR